MKSYGNHRNSMEILRKSVENLVVGLSSGSFPVSHAPTEGFLRLWAEETSKGPQSGLGLAQKPTCSLD